MITLITKNNLTFTKPKCNCGISINKKVNKKMNKRKLLTKKINLKFSYV